MMNIICPVCEREIKIGVDHFCPVCDTDLSALVMYHQEKSQSTTTSRRWWLFLVVLFVPLIWFLFQRDVPEPEISMQTIVVTATNNRVVISQQVFDSPTPIVTPTVTQIPSPTATQQAEVTPTQTPQKPPEALAQINLNCRTGPGTDYDITGFFYKDTQVQIQAVLEDGSWLMIPHPQRTGLACWVWADATIILGDLTIVPSLYPTN